MAIALQTVTDVISILYFSFNSEVIYPHPILSLAIKKNLMQVKPINYVFSPSPELPG